MDETRRTRGYLRDKALPAWLKNSYTSCGAVISSGVSNPKQVHELSGDRDFVFIGDHDHRKPMSENTVNKALRVMGYDTKVEVCGHGFRTMACSSLIESGLWSRDAVERQMSHMERNSVRAAYIHEAEHLDERKLMLQWWADFLDANRDKGITPFDYAKINRGNGD